MLNSTLGDNFDRLPRGRVGDKADELQGLLPRVSKLVRLVGRHKNHVALTERMRF